MFASQSVDEAEPRRLRARSEDFVGRRQQRVQLRIAIRRAANGIAVHAERDVVQEEATVHLAHVDPAFQAVGERVERAHKVVTIYSEVEREVVAGAGGHADERQAVLPSNRRRNRERPVAAGHPERIRAAGDGVAHERGQVLIRTQHDDLDPAFARPLRKLGARGFATAGAGIDEENRAFWWVDRTPGVPRVMPVAPHQEDSVSDVAEEVLMPPASDQHA